MERLTTRNSVGVAVLKTPYQCDRCGEEIYRLADYGNGEPIEKLARYEELEEQGKLMKLPCAVGDAVYVKMQSGGYAEAEVRDFSYFLSCGFCVVVTSDKFNKQHIPFTEFGKTVFPHQRSSRSRIERNERMTGKG